MQSRFPRRKERLHRPSDGQQITETRASLQIAVKGPEANYGLRGGSMRLDQEEQSSNVEDRRGARFSPGLATGGIGTLAIVLIGLFFGIDPTVLLQGTSVDTNAPPSSNERAADSNDPMKDFVARVLGSTERTWSEIFARNGRTYQPP